MSVLLTGIGWVTPGGTGRGRDFDTPPELSGTLPRIARKAFLARPLPRFGRLDDYSRCGLAAASLALKDGGLDLWKRKRNVGIISSTITGCLHTDSDYFDTVIAAGGHLASPNLFAYTLPNAFLGEAAIHFGLAGAAFAVYENPLTGMASVRFAIASIIGGECSSMLAGMCNTEGTGALGADEEHPAGSIFALLRRRNGRIAAPKAYGEIDWNEEGEVSFNGRRVDSVLSLVRMCIDGPTGAGARS